MMLNLSLSVKPKLKSEYLLDAHKLGQLYT